MTRINLIPPSELTRQHLIAEYKELPRTFNLVRARIARGHSPADCRIPDAYRLGTGHVTFFYDKLGFLSDRYLQLVAEMKSRGYEVNYPEPNSGGIGQEWMGGYTPTPEAISLSRQRIDERNRK